MDMSDGTGITTFLAARLAEDERRTDAAEWLIRTLAAIWSDHPDYDQAWKP